MIYRAILLDTRGTEILSRRFHTKQNAIRQCQIWQLQFEYEFFDTEIKEEEEV